MDASSPASFISVSSAPNPAGTPPATIWSSLPGSSALSCARAEPSRGAGRRPAPPVRSRGHPDRLDAERWQGAAVDAAPAPARSCPPARQIPRPASGRSRVPKGARAIAGSCRPDRAASGHRRAYSANRTPAPARQPAGLHPADPGGADAEGKPSSPAERVVAGAIWRRKPSWVSSIGQVARLSNSLTSMPHAAMRRKQATRPGGTAAIPARRALQPADRASLLPYLWPAGRPAARRCASSSRSCSWCSRKSPPSTCRWSMRAPVDALAPKTPAPIAARIPVALILAYGAAARRLRRVRRNPRRAVRLGAAARGPRQLALRTFRHLHALSLRFHMDRQTGGLSRVIDRGVLRHAVRAAAGRLQCRPDGAGTGAW